MKGESTRRRSPLPVILAFLVIVGVWEAAARLIGNATLLQLLLMDEPFAALDAQTRSVLQEELLGIWQATRKAVLFVTHSIAEAVYLADTVVVMTSGPGRVKAVVPVPEPRPRDETSVEFNRTQRVIRDLLRPEIRAA